MSGDMNTALGNCLLMSCMVWAYKEELGIECSLVNNGDDCVVFMEKEDCPRFCARLDKWFLEMGFKMKVEDPVDEINQVEFCQCQPICVNGTWTMVRNPRVSLAKDSICLRPEMVNTVPCFNAWASAVGKCGLSLAGGVPVVQELYKRMENLGVAAKRVNGFGDCSTGLEFMAKRMRNQYTEPDAVTRYQFWLAFDITPDEQLALEKHIRTVEHVPETSLMISPDDFGRIPLSH